ncbi:RNA polymerase-associated protein RapA [Halieaceae bacterium IMCC14734]|uniref:RNA polymerase-associated protein RapA n=1 Tax=Candidatus Litorirhabdus singularis TaxID=2518993 RepID=A0ABT3TGU5_9GAMM|nr:RNA polymerase-associated protein RapA [Candidatus Litorirhabdus singularis]MCX2981536.1 RNA polymerase-associated protein RapA [Candidatus Litorirhabdus singularis]
MEYIVGQRWVSHADAQLGLGIIAELDGRRVTVSFPAIGEERTYATDNAPLTRLRFKSGDNITTIDDIELCLIDVTEVSGILYYTGLDSHDEEHQISELELDSFVQLTTPQQRLLNGHFDGNSQFALRVATFDHLNQLQQSPARGLLGSRTSLLPHQVYIASEVGRRFSPRVLLADEVGLGKTIEAGMIIHQQLLSGRAQRVLIVVPESLLHQWLVEMLRRFNMHFALFDAERVDAMTESNPFDAEQLVLCSLDFLKARPDMAALALDCEWDLTIVDEAHHLQWSTTDASAEYLLVEQLAKISAGLLLLTATPEQIGQASHFARLRLLDPERFHDLDLFIAEESGFKQLNQQLKQLEADHAATAEIDDLLDRHGTGRVLFRNTRAGIQGFPERQLHTYPLPNPDAYITGDDERALLYPELNHAEEDWIERDPRVSWLEQTLKQLRPNKVLVICANADTAIALEHFLQMRAGIRSAAFYEGLSILERDRAAAYFADSEAGAQTLVCSEIGSEGRNFQFAHHLVLFDLPLNPDLLEQRIGRLDRIGQTSAVEIHVPFLEGSAQATLLRWYDEGLNVFRESCSAGFAIYEKFAERLQEQLRGPNDQLEKLLQETASFTELTRAELREGRDRLLERNSCKPEIANSIIEEISEAEQTNDLLDYLDLLCNAYGVDQDYHSEHALILRPGEHMLTGYFPGLREEGTTISFNREQALAREDIDFLTWEHPMIVESMDMVASTELGNAAIATLNLKGIAAGTLLLEAVYTINCVAPRGLQLERFLPVSPIRLLVDSRGKDLAALVPHERLNDLCEKVKKPTALAIIKQVREEVEEKMQHAAKLASQQMNTVLEAAETTMREQLRGELERLQALAAVNPSIRSEEIEHLRVRTEECSAHIGHATLQLQALRLIITT